MESIYYELFELMSREHGITLLETELQDIVQVATKIEKMTEQSEGPVERGVMRQWVVSVNVNGEDVVNISAHGVGGIENCHEYTDEIRECARNLLAFIGEGA